MKNTFIYEIYEKQQCTIISFNGLLNGFQNEQKMRTNNRKMESSEEKSAQKHKCFG